MDPGVPGPSTPVTEGSGGGSDDSRSYAEEIVAGVSPSHPDAAGLMGNFAVILPSEN